MENQTDSIKIGNKTVKRSSSGYFKCPYRCQTDKRYPQLKWKTEAGFLRHISSCTNSPEAIARREERDKNDRLLQKQRSEAGIANFSHKVGDLIFFVHQITLKPTHVLRGERMVRVRYEPELRFEGRSAKIESIDFDNSILINGYIREPLYSNFQEAELASKDKQKGHEEHVKFSQMCR